MAHNGKITKRHEYFVPALSPGTPRVQVSRKYWTRLFDVYHNQLKTLQSITATPDPVAALVSDTGRHDHHHEICQELKDTIESVDVKFLAAAEDHYVPQERVASRWLNLGEGVTWRIVWEQVLAEYQFALVGCLCRIAGKAAMCCVVSVLTEACSTLRPLASFRLAKW